MPDQYCPRMSELTVTITIQGFMTQWEIKIHEDFSGGIVRDCIICRSGAKPVISHARWMPYNVDCNIDLRASPSGDIPWLQYTALDTIELFYITPEYHCAMSKILA